MKQSKILLLALSACVLLGSCARLATVRERRPVLQPIRTTVGAMVLVGQELRKAIKDGDREPLAGLGGCLTAAQGALAQLEKDPHDKEARDTYNFALSRAFGLIKTAGLDPWTRPLTVPTPQGPMTLTRRPDARKAWNPALYEFTPADQFDVDGLYVHERVTKEGLGAPLVAVGRKENTDARENFFLPRTYYGVTAVARFKGRECEIAFEDPLATENVTVQGRTHPLAADFTTPIAVMLASTDTSKMGLARLMNPEKYADTARIARLQPYDPDKTVILVVHGLNSAPPTWTPMINALRGDEAIRENYQFWFYSYPSGYPYPHSAAILRSQLDAIQQRFPLRKKMVVIGHSMGGCISRLLITDAGDKLWMRFFGKPPAEVELDAETKELFEHALIFNHRPEVGRVIFVAAPLRGADMATHWTGRLGSRLVRSPVKLLRAGTSVLAAITFQGGGMNLKRMPNSIDTLAPTNRFVVAINELPLTPGIPYHTIMGDRGRGGNKDQTKPISSDGIVPYWSSHLDGAQSELIVPSGHSAHQNPKAIEEVRRILKLHAGRSE